MRFTRWFVTLSSLKPGGAASGFLSAGGMWSVSGAAKQRLLCPFKGINF